MPPTNPGKCQLCNGDISEYTPDAQLCVWCEGISDEAFEAPLPPDVDEDYADEHWIEEPNYDPREY